MLTSTNNVKNVVLQGWAGGQNKKQHMGLAYVSFTLQICQVHTQTCSPTCLIFSLSLAYTLRRTHVDSQTHNHAEQQDSCPPSANVIHEDMEFWVMSDEFFSTNGLANDSRKTNRSIYEKD